MRRFSQPLLVVVSALLATPALAQDAIHWHNDLESAKTMAKSTNRLVLIHFWAPSCGPCMALERNVFNQPGVAAAIEQQFVPVKLNADENSATAQLYGIERIPTDVVTTPDGRIISKMVSPPTPAAYVSELTSTAGKYASKLGQTYSNAASTAPAPSQLNSAYARLPISPAAPATSSSVGTQPKADQIALSAPSTGTTIAGGSGTITPTASTPGFPTVPAATSPIQAATPTTATAMIPALPVAQTTPAQRPAPQPSATTSNASPPAPQVVLNPALQPNAATAPQPPITPIGAPSYQPAPSALAATSAAVPNQAVNPYFASTSTAISQPSQVPPEVALPGQSATPALPQGPSGYTSQATPPAGSSAPSALGAAPAAAAFSHASAASAAASNGSVPDPRLLPPGAPPLAFEGYCPVTMRNTWKWVPGDPQYGIVHLGRTYWFAGPQEQKQFWTDPARYAPALSGNDPVLAIDHKQQVAGKREHSLDYDGLFYMFASEATLQQFAANPAKYAASVRQAMGLPRGRLVR
ncbi:MAG: thioredoxin family protein [Pirellulales bacterium]